MPSGAGEPRRVRERLTVCGIVQGVGFRPHVHQLAAELALDGFVVNSADGVVIEIEGAPATLDLFAGDIVRRAPRLAVIESVDRRPITVIGEAGFEIRASEPGRVTTLVSPDVATCDECLAEMADPADRRHGYAFTNCTNCGPRYTIVTGIPYDRQNTTMAGFAMCAECRAEYEDVGDRRFHAQPVCCRRCGPQLDTPLDEVAAALHAGEVVAVKGLGGYHLAVLASSEPAVARLRARKHREDKPFAVMAADLDAARRLCVVGDAEAALLRSPARPIVLMPRRDGAPVASSVAPGLGELGVMLPYTPLHHLLLAAVGKPIVLTSANVSDEPIAYRDDDARARLGPIADRFVTHDRPIHTRVDDSVLRVVDGAPYPLRRARGYAPAPISVPWAIPRPLLACGAELKSAVALARGRQVFVSQHIGDLKNYEAYRSFVDAIDHLGELFEIRPEIVAHDLHPQYLSTQYALELAEGDGLDLVGVQHHHAHIASCLADNGVAGPVIGVAFDGTGYGADETVWGGELLVADLADYQRVGWLAPVPLPGGDAAIREPWRMAASYLGAVEAAGPRTRRPGRWRPPDVTAERWADVLALARSGVGSPPTSSAGRLFDAVAAAVGVRSFVNYEGQAAIELEALVDPDETTAYEMAIEGRTLVGADLVAAAITDAEAGAPVGTIAARFHHGLAGGVAALCEQIRAEHRLSTVALSGGVFANVVLLRHLTRLLSHAGFEVLRHHRLPCNDGGISFGQAAVVAARDRRDAPSRRTA